MMQAEWLSIVMQGSFSEVYVIDCDTLQFLQVNDAACANLQYAESELLRMSLLAITPALTKPALIEMMKPLCDEVIARLNIETVHMRKDRSTYSVEFRIFHTRSDERPVCIAIGNDTSSKKASAEALNSSEARFRAIVSNTPGLVYQFLRKPDGSVSFPYLSEGCHALLGISADELHADSSLLLNLILAEDRPSYLDSMQASMAELKSWNWEGRIWIEEWRDIKWINLRATPRQLPNGSVQWEGIMTNITESKLEQAEIRRSREQLAELSAHVEIVKEKERTRIAREIHDDVGGNLTAIKMALSMLTKRLPGEDSALIEKATYVDSLIDRTFEAVHRIAGDLRPSILDCGIVAAIDWQAKEFEKQTGILCIFISSHKDIELRFDQATALFRIFQEALTNVSKHAQASQVTVHLIRKAGKISLEVVDNGRGIVEADQRKPKSFGLRGMNERVEALGGKLSIGPAPEGGTAVAIEIPL
ncbi:histidine kinase [Oxalobacteraceae bacterium R-40]|uniref:Histidine kinase n=1 Tax=Keguizhuia sedimenti TaxID=3064264 RepID=A0ABU1BQU2_9BURK|nr:histidine kinase [Oxalobacteraceae bacterium R-40]